MSEKQSEKLINLKVSHAAGEMEFDGDLADGLFLAARHLTEQERAHLAERIIAYRDREVMGS